MGCFLMAVRQPHKVFGHFYGMFYETSTGKKLYLAHRKRKQIYELKWAWCIDLITLNKCRDLGVEAVGVIWRDAGKTKVHLTHIDDFFGPASFSHFGDTRQRGLPLKCFRVDPAKSAKIIEKIVKIR